MPDKKKIMDVLIYCFAIYFAIVGGLYLAQRNIIYIPTKSMPDPAEYPLVKAKPVHTETQDGLVLTAWQIGAKQKEAPIIVWFHGNAQNHAARSFLIKPFIDLGYGALLASYRGYGGNPGSPTEEGLYQDARAWINSIQEARYPLDKVILLGESLGSGVAVQMATEFPDIKALVLVAPYTSLVDAAKARYFFVPVNWLLKDRYDSLSKINNVKAPVVVLQGDQDFVIPPKLGRTLFDQANEPKKFIRFEGYGHNNLPYPDIANHVSNFLAQMK